LVTQDHPIIDPSRLENIHQEAPEYVSANLARYPDLEPKPRQPGPGVNGAATGTQANLVHLAEFAPLRKAVDRPRYDVNHENSEADDVKHFRHG
jgi:hypothetical protein